MELSGRLATFAIADILQWAQTSMVSGSVVFREVSREVSVSLDGGRVTGAVSTEPEEFFGRRLLAVGQIDEMQLLQAVRFCRERGVLLGHALVAQGALSEDDVARELAQHIRDVVCGVFLWRRGVFSFGLQGSDVRGTGVELEAIDTMGIVLEGTRWLDELERFREALGDDDSCLLPGPAHADAEPESPLARRILWMFQSGMSLSRSHRLVGGSYFRFMEAAADLVHSGVFEVRRIEPPGAGSQDRAELNRFLDEAVEARLADLGAADSIPVEALGRLRPVMLAGAPFGPAAEGLELPRAPDGRTTLGDWLSPEPRERDRQLRWLALEVRRGRMALVAPDEPVAMPPAADETERPPSFWRRWWARLR